MRGLAGLGRTITDTFDVPNHDLRSNGEAGLLRAIGPAARVVIDVGAFEGEWALEAARHCPDATVYCFELVGANRERLLAAVGGHPRIVVAGCGLAEAAGERAVKHYPDAPWVSSLCDFPHDGRAEWRSEPVDSGDAWLAANGDPAVDLLKLDTEGAEHLVLRGFGSALARGRIAAVQFEYGRVNAVTGFLLRDLYGLLGSYGFVTGRLRRGGTRFAPYRFEDEDFRGPNYLAVRSDRADLVELLGRGRSRHRG